MTMEPITVITVVIHLGTIVYLFIAYKAAYRDNKKRRLSLK